MSVSYVVCIPLLCNITYMCYTYVITGEFGKVYKGTWVHMSPNGNAISEVVAVKTIKSILCVSLYITNYRTTTGILCMCIRTYVDIQYWCY